MQQAHDAITAHVPVCLRPALWLYALQPQILVMANPRPVLLKIKTARPSTSQLTEKQAQRRRGYRYSKCSGLTAGAKHAPLSTPSKLVLDKTILHWHFQLTKSQPISAQDIVPIKSVAPENLDEDAGSLSTASGDGPLVVKPHPPGSNSCRPGSARKTSQHEVNRASSFHCNLNIQQH